MIKQLFSLILITLLCSLLHAQESEKTFNKSFHGNYNIVIDNYSVNMEMDTAADIVLYLDNNKTNIIVTSNSDTIFNHHILNIRNDQDYLIYNTTNLFHHAVFMMKDNEGVTMLYDRVDETENQEMYYKEKYFWSNK